jgi:hypothetical protein
VKIGALFFHFHALLAVSSSEVQSLDRRLRKMGFPQHSQPTYRILVSRPWLNGLRQGETCHSLVRDKPGRANLVMTSKSSSVPASTDTKANGATTCFPAAA